MNTNFASQTNFSTKKITLNFKSFLYRYLLGSRDRVAINLEDAYTIAAIDNDEQFVHVQFTDIETNEPLKDPVVWWITEWKTWWKKYALDKAAADASRREANRLRENTEKLCKAMAYRNNLFETSDKEIFRAVALKICKAKDTKTALHYGVTLDLGE